MNTLIKIIVTVALGLLSFKSFAQNSSNLWKVEGNGIHTSYLFGTMHLIPQSDFVLKEKVKDAFKHSELVVLEINMASPEFMQDVMALGYFQDGDQLKTYMDDSEYELLDTYLKEKTGQGMEVYNSVKPAMLLSVIMMASMDEALASFEGSLMSMAKDQNKLIEGFETYASQMKIYNEVYTYERQIDDMIEIIEKPAENAKILNKMIKLYAAEDIEGLYTYMDVYMKGDAEVITKLLDERNNNWIPQIAKFSKEKPTFYGFGAGHLGGDQGVVNLLKQQGYSVTPVLDGAE